ncbi:hypothetical protein BaRGS_00032468 [Batillaria attramentaria]|uniref:Uncharacterized protein n=1 Tax=Batillaria attramentaria TaxID=370345 RepID=A0ABD0JNM2_9CAEN
MTVFYGSLRSSLVKRQTDSKTGSRQAVLRRTGNLKRSIPVQQTERNFGLESTADRGFRFLSIRFAREMARASKRSRSLLFPPTDSSFTAWRLCANGYLH